MPASSASLALTDNYRERLLGSRLAVALSVRRAWAGIVPEDLEGSFGRFQDSASATLEVTTRANVALADAYLATYLTEETGRRADVRGWDPEPYLVTEDGRGTRQLLLPALLTVKMALGRGLPLAKGLELGLVRATRAASHHALAAPRRAQADLMRDDDRFRGYRRATAANSCGACLALADGQVLPLGESLRQHTHCRCAAEPVVRGVRERAFRPTGQETFRAMTPAEQARLFHGRGGEEKADLIRSGAVPFEALVTRSPQVAMEDQFTEAPLGALRELAQGQRRDGLAEPEQERRDA